MKDFKRKLIIYNIIVVLAVFIVFIVIQGFYSFGVYKEARIRDYIKMMDQLKEGVDHQLAYQVEQVPNRLLNNTEVRESVYNDYQWTSVRIFRMKDIITNFLTESKYITGLDIYYHQDDIAFLSGSYKKIENYNSKPYIDWIYNVQDFNQERNWIATRYYEPMEQEVASCVVNIPFLPSTLKGKIALHLDMDELQNYAENFIDGIGQVRIINTFGQNITGEAKDNELIIEALENDEHYFEYQAEEKRITFIRESQVNNWVYVYDLPRDEVYNLKSFVVGNGVMGILFITLTAITTTFINLIIYGPIKQIFSLVDRIPIEMPEEQAALDTDIIKSKLTKLVNTYDQLETDVKMNKQIISGYHLKGFMRGKYTYQDILDTGYIDFNYETGFCTAIQLRDTHSQEQSRQLLNAIRDTLNQDFNSYACYSALDGDIIYALFCVLDKYVVPANTVKRTLLHLNIEDLVYVGIGKSFDFKSDSVIDSYSAAKNALKYAFIMPEMTYFDAEKEKYDDYKTTGSRDFIINNLEKSLLLCDYDACELELARIFHALHYGKYHIHYCTNTCYEVCSTIRRACGQLGYGLDQHLQYDLRDSIYTIKNINELEIKLKNIIYNSLITISNEMKTTYNSGNELRLTIEKIIHDNLFNDISLQFIADSVEMRYDTLSRNFQSIMGCTYSKYIKKIKLDKSVELLAQNKYTVKDIASLLGYNSTHYFIQVFKKHYGMTPKKYQEIELQAEE
ncbi:helix-turn-helix transcriptional regulator [Vallitalea okinawensis]|uniref:helix-turn-helix transcriptional regulator n=1 Tax=Vallitalea okinawensis TaxID=2078660 RepID=UPI000CFAB5A8|nr:AraC family transcriptional regulator [Vallitalea okinawensis]